MIMIILDAAKDNDDTKTTTTNSNLWHMFIFVVHNSLGEVSQVNSKKWFSQDGKPYSENAEIVARSLIQLFWFFNLVCTTIVLLNFLIAVVNKTF